MLHDAPVAEAEGVRRRDRFRIGLTLRMFDLHTDARVVGSVLRWWRRSPWGRSIGALVSVFGLTLLVHAIRNSWELSWPSWESFGMAIVVLFLVGFVWAAATTQRR